MIPLSPMVGKDGKPTTEWIQYLNGPVPLKITLAGSYTPNCISTNSFQITQTGAVTIQTATNIDPGEVMYLEFIGSGGITFSTAYKFPGGTIPTWGGSLNLAAFYNDGAQLLYVGGGAAYA